MTLIREPGTVEYAIHKAACDLTADGESGYDILGKALGFASGNLVRKWSNPNQPERPSFTQCLVVDQVYVARGCGTPPMQAVYELRLEALTRDCEGHVPAAPLDRLHDVTTEVGQVLPVLIPTLLADNPTPRQIRQARKEVAEAIEVLQKADADLVAMTQTKDIAESFRNATGNERISA